jgi:hypothetical protein
MPAKRKRPKHVAVYCDHELYNQLKACAERNLRSVSAQVLWFTVQGLKAETTKEDT